MVSGSTERQPGKPVKDVVIPKGIVGARRPFSLFTNSVEMY